MKLLHSKFTQLNKIFDFICQRQMFNWVKTPNSKLQIPNSDRRFIAALFGIIALLSGLAAFFLLPTDASAAVIRRAPNNLGLVGYWSFDDARGSTATDFSGNGNAGTLTNMDPGSDWVAGKRGSALEFDGSDDYVTAGQNIELANKSFTVSAWIYKTLDNKEVYFSAHTAAETRKTLHFRVLSDGDLKFGYFRDDLVTTSQPVSFNEWEFITMTYDKESDTSTVYVNGEQVTSGSQGPLEGSNPEIVIGRFEANTTQHFTGAIDEVRTYDRALSASEIKDLYNAGGKATRNATADALYPDKLVSHWSMDGPDVSGSTVKDVFGANDGTKNGDPVARRGRLGQALEFKKAEREHVQVPHDSAFNPKNLSLSLWMYRVGDQDRWAEAFMKGRYFESDGCSKWSWGLEQNGNSGSGKWKWDVCHEGGENSIETNKIPNKEWTHIVGTYASSTSKLQLYQNGELIDSKVRSGDRISNTGDIYIGCYGDGACSGFSSGGAFNGKIDDVRFYDSVLSAEEVSRLYTATKPDTINSSQNEKLTDGLVGMWSFDGPDLSGTTAEDVSGNGNDGTLQNDPQPAIGRIGQALEFDTDSEEVRVDDTSTLLPSTVTACTWLKDTGSKNSSGWMQPIRKRQWDDEGYEMSFTEDNRTVTWHLLASDGRSGITYSNIKHNEWYHLCGTFDGSTSRLYVNGELEASQADDMGLNTTNRFEIGKSSGGVDATFDNIRVYDRALSESEIERLYSLGR